MKVVLIGSGGREHALAYKIAESQQLEKLYILPGNPGTKNIGSNIAIEVNDHNNIISFCVEHKIDLVVIGPEKPLVDGLTDKLTELGIKVFGPTKEAARIEGEKSFAKELMKKKNIPTAAFEIFHKEDYAKAISYLNQIDYPIVLKADGIAAGKGVIIVDNFEQAQETIDDIFKKSVFGSAGDKLVIEEFMTGQEASIFVITDGIEFVILPAAQDHKRIFDGDKGKNTGGMGAYAPTPFVKKEDLEKIIQSIINPTLEGMKENGSPFVGCLYCGLMMTKEGPKVVEFNCRFGDPETQVVLPLLKGDLLELLYSAASGKINKNAIEYNGGSSISVVAASGGYPDKYEKGKEIFGLEKFINSEDIIVFHAGTKEIDGKIVTGGGRVLDVTSICNENNLSKAKTIAYKAIDKISFDGIQYRKDISDKAMKRI
jgi:phosphoribosylamine--glycine ligase